MFAGSGRERDSHLWERDGSGTELHGNGTGAGQLFAGSERAAVGLNN